MRIVVVSNTTMDPLVSQMRTRAGSDSAPGPDHGAVGHEMVVSGVGDLLSWLIDPTSPAAEAATDLVLVCPDGDSVVPPLGAEDTVDELLGCLDRFAAAHPGTAVVATTLLLSTRSPWSHADPASPGGRFAARARWEMGLAEQAASHPNLHVLDLRALAEHHGAPALVNDAYWYLGRLRFTTLGFSVIAAELTNLIGALSNRARKVLVCDLDNTLWGGVLGEDGIGGIALGEDGPGKCYRDLQRHIRALREAGTLLAVVSKNDPEIVEEVLAEHPMMVIGSEDLVAVSADWSDKATRIAALADSLDLGLDAFVFIDDNPVERELVRTALPLVAVPEFPDRVENLARWFVDEVVPAWFPRAWVLDEDRNKTGQYRARQQRRELQAPFLDGGGDMESFLASLDIRLGFRTDDESLVPRLSQLTQKTNQFNLTTDRLSTAEIQDLIASPDHTVIACDYADRFGEEGTIGLAVVDLARGELANLLLSCRVLGRRVEDRLLAEIERRVGDRGHDRVRASFVPTARNGVAAGFLTRVGFVPVAGGSGVDQQGVDQQDVDQQDVDQQDVDQQGVCDQVWRGEKEIR